MKLQLTEDAPNCDRLFGPHEMTSLKGVYRYEAMRRRVPGNQQANIESLASNVGEQRTLNLRRCEHVFVGCRPIGVQEQRNISGA